MRLKDKVAIVVGAGQSPGEGMGNGRATVLRFAQEGAKVLAVDNPLTKRIVWQYGHTDSPGTGPDQLRIPDGFDLLTHGATPTHPDTG